MPLGMTPAAPSRLRLAELNPWYVNPTSSEPTKSSSAEEITSHITSLKIMTKVGSKEYLLSMYSVSSIIINVYVNFYEASSFFLDCLISIYGSANGEFDFLQEN